MDWLLLLLDGSLVVVTVMATVMQVQRWRGGRRWFKLRKVGPEGGSAVGHAILVVYGGEDMRREEEGCNDGLCRDSGGGGDDEMVTVVADGGRRNGYG